MNEKKTKKKRKTTVRNALKKNKKTEKNDVLEKNS